MTRRGFDVYAGRTARHMPGRRGARPLPTPTVTATLLALTLCLGVLSCADSDDPRPAKWSVTRRDSDGTFRFGFTERPDRDTGTFMWQAELWHDPDGVAGLYARDTFARERWVRLHELSRPAAIAAYVDDEGCGDDLAWEDGPSSYYLISILEDFGTVYRGCLSAEATSHAETVALIQYLDELAAEFERAVVERGTAFP